MLAMDGQQYIQHMLVINHVMIVLNSSLDRTTVLACRGVLGYHCHCLVVNLKKEIRLHSSLAVITVSGFKSFGCQSSFHIGPNGVSGVNVLIHVVKAIGFDPENVQLIQQLIVLEMQLKPKVVI